MNRLEKYPKISIITPSYNQGQYLEKTICSILDQNYPYLEYIIIDGGSTDNSVDIIKKYQDRIAYWVSEKDKGTFDANNKGLAKVTGDYWCVVNSDDLLLPGAINLVVETITNNPDQKWLTGGVYNINEKGDVLDHKWLPVTPKPNSLNLSFLSGCWIPHPAVFLHKSLIETVGAFSAYHCMDYDYWLRVEYAGFKPFCIQKELSALRIHIDCKSANVLKLQEEIFELYFNFCSDKKLLKNDFVKERLNELQMNILKVKLTFNLIDNNKAESLSILLKMIKIDKGILLKRSTIGAFKRIVLGVSSTDALHNLYNRNGEANWNSF